MLGGSSLSIVLSVESPYQQVLRLPGRGVGEVARGGVGPVALGDAGGTEGAGEWGLWVTYV